MILTHRQPKQDLKMSLLKFQVVFILMSSAHLSTSYSINFFAKDGYQARLFGTSRISTTCETLPWWMWKKTSSVITDKCVLLFDSKKCQGSHIRLEEGQHSTLPDFNNSAVSYRSCYKYDTKNEFRFSAYAEQNFEYLLYDGVITPGCNKLDNKRPLMLGSVISPICVVIYRGNDCTGNETYAIAGRHSELPLFFENKVQSFSVCDPEDLKAQERTYKLSANIIRFEMNSNEWEVLQKTTTDVVDVDYGSRALIRNNGTGTSTETITFVKSFTDRIDIVKSKGLSKMHDVSVSGTVSNDFTKGFRDSLNTGFRTTSSQGQNQGRTSGTETGGSSSSSVSTGASRSSSSSSTASRSFGTSENSGTSDSQGRSSSYGENTNFGRGSTRSKSRSNGFKESSIFGETSDFRQSYGDSTSDTHSTNSETTVSAKVGFNYFVTAEVGFSHTDSSGRSNTRTSSSDRSYSSGTSKTDERTRTSDVTDTDTESHTRDRGFNRNSGSTSDHTRTSNRGSTSEHSRTGSHSVTGENSINHSNSNSRHSSSTSGTSFQSHREFSSERNAFINEERNIEGKIGRALSKSYQDMKTTSDNLELRNTTEQTKTFSIEKSIVVPPCTEYQVSASVKSTRNFPVNYSVFVEVSGTFDDGEVLTASELWQRLEELSYVETKDDTTIIAKGEGFLSVDYTWYSLLQANGKAVQGCSERTIENDDRPEVSFYENNDYKSLIHKTVSTGKCQLLPYFARGQVMSVKSTVCVILFPTEKCETVDERNEFIGYTLEVPVRKGSSLPFFGEMTVAFQECQSYYNLQQNEHFSVKFYADNSLTMAPIYINEDIGSKCRNLPFSKRGLASFVDTNTCLILYSETKCEGEGFTVLPHSALLLKDHFNMKTASFKVCPERPVELVNEEDYQEENIELFAEKNFTALLFDGKVSAKCTNLMRQKWRKTSAILTDSCAILYSLPYCQGKSYQFDNSTELPEHFDNMVMSFTSCKIYSLIEADQQPDNYSDIDSLAVH